MNPQFRLTEPAIDDIEQIADYIASQSGFTQADRFLTKLDGWLNRHPFLPKVEKQGESFP
ncbi:MAG: type II toxin-antitoxin system RelE/ParE family toxin [Cyanosarcina radialis HA8281-LM2]|jgi:toxin ParE1/3/4|nr:type II toxin-antitoxin system RelE/ParE family toxin [Cyanosarcina radialis HA8281-LM2]